MANEKKQGIVHIQQLIQEGKLKEAYASCNKLLLNFPENIRLKKLQKKIEKKVYKQNVDVVKQDLKKLAPLWKEQRYKEIIEQLQKLQQYAPGFKPVEKELYKAQKLYKKQQVQKQKGAVKQYSDQIKHYIDKGKYQEAITQAKRFLMKVPNHQGVSLLEKKARDLYIVQQLKENQSLLKSNKFKEIEEFLHTLLTINPESHKVKELLKKAEKRETVALSYEKKDFAYQSMEHIRTLLQKHKWEKAVQALEELLRVDKHNVKALEMLDTARKKFDKQLTREVVDKIKQLQKKFKDKRAQNPKMFIRL
ncbi:hypothetical protein GF369_03800 [Candidatus Peregrinibacteria bacterium]|nr:hypothetical protein [Candidatus Peregrinibacteria bacterium]